ncbi:MAG: M20/M25/M40 family metallo-hydrolase [candidate division WS1 bacterium]|jgi:tripeptide aminopeptidase|nr:M20/M25/M40 family metallo-hydrolase [candidate division WS1 bacterium]
MHDQLLDLFLRLVAVDSPSGHEQAVAELVATELRSLGLEPQWDEAHKTSPAECGNVLALLPATAEGYPPLLLNAHVDTVTHDQPIVAIVEDGVVRSAENTILGADDKAGVALLLVAARRLVEERLPHGDLWLVFTVAEEIGLWGAREMDFTRLEPWPEMGLVLDGGRRAGEMVTGAPSATALDVTLTGKAAHAGVCPEDGISAIAVAARAIAEMRLGRLDEETTANVGTICGGSARNIVPETCTLQAEARSYSPEKLAAQLQHMQEQILQAAEAAGAHAEIEVQESYRTFLLSEEAPVVQRARAAAERLGLTPHTQHGGGGSDANVFNQRGIPSVILSTGAAEVHTPQEEWWLEVAEESLQWVLEIVTSQG